MFAQPLFLLTLLLAHTHASPVPPNPTTTAPTPVQSLLMSSARAAASSIAAAAALRPDAPELHPLLYVAAYSGALQTLRFAEKDQGLAKVARLDVVDTSRDCGAQPSWLTLDKDADRLFCVDEAGAALHVFKTGGEGGPTPKGSVSGLLAGPAHGVLHPGGRSYTFAHYAAGAISTVDTSKLAVAGQYGLDHALKAGQVADRQASSHPHQSVVDPTGRYLVVPDLGADVVHVLAIDDATGSLSLLADLALPPGSGPRHVAFATPAAADDGDSSTFMYVVNELANTLHGWRVTYPGSSSSGGCATPAPCFDDVWRSSTHGLFGPPAADGAAAAELLVSPDNRFLLLSSRFDQAGAGDEDALVSFAIDPRLGSLGAAAVRPAGGRGPRAMALNHDGSRLAVALQQSAKVVVFARDVSTGEIGNKLGVVATAAEPVAIVWDE